jgi:hypothetical protein
LSAAVASVTSSAFAATRDWIQPAGGAFSDGANWSGGVAPGANDFAQFLIGGSYTVTFAASATNANFLFGTSSGAVTFEGSGAPTYHLTNTATINGGSLTLGTTAGRQMTLRVDQTLAIHNNSTLFASVGSDVVAGQLLLGYVAAGTSGDAALSVAGTGSTLSVTGPAELGTDGRTGTIIVSADANATFGGLLELAADSAANSGGAVNVTNHVNQTLALAQDIKLAANPVSGQFGTITIGGAGAGTSAMRQADGTSLIVGAASGNLGGTVTVSIGGTFVTPGGTGTATINRTGNLVVAGGTLSLEGDTTINGGRLVRNSGTLNLNFGKTISVTNGGSVSITGDMDLRNGSMNVGAASSLTVSGTTRLGSGGSGTSQLGQLHLYSGATATLGDLEISVGGTTRGYLESFVPLNLGSVAIGSGGANQLGLIDAYAPITQTGPLTLGAAGLTSNSSYRLNVIDTTYSTGPAGAAVYAQSRIDLIGASTFNANGDLTIDGGEFTAGSATLQLASGTRLNVRNGGILTLSSVLTVGPARDALLDGATSRLNAFGGLNLGFPGGDASLTISNGAIADVRGSGLRVGRGIGGTASVSILSGGRLVTNQEVSIGGGTILATQVARVLVSGAGSALTQGNEFSRIAVGTSDGGPGFLEVRDGALLKTGTSGLYVAAKGRFDLANASLDLGGNLFVTGGAASADFAGPSGGTFSFKAARSFLITGGGRVDLLNMQVATPGQNTIEVTGAGSRFSLGDELLAVRNDSRAIVSDGGTLAGGALFVGWGTGTASFNKRASVEITGPGSTLLLSTNWMRIGYEGGEGTVTFKDGATGTIAGIVLGDNQGSTGTLNVRSGAAVNASLYSFEMHDGGTMNISDPGSILTYEGPDMFADDGAVINVVNGGSLVQNSPGGRLALEDGGTLNIDGGSVTVPGFEIVNGTLNFAAGKLRITRDFKIGSGSPLGSALTLSADRVLEVDGTLTIDPFRSVTLAGGRLTVGQLAGGGALHWTAGTFAVTGTNGLSIAAGGPLGATVSLADGRTLEVTATLNIAAGSLLHIGGGQLAAAGGVTNAGTLLLESSTAQLSGGTFVNSGLVAGHGRIANPLNNRPTGEVRAGAGQTLRFTSTAAQLNAGRVNLLGGTAEFDGPLTNQAGGVIGGRGALVLHDGVRNSGQLAFSGGLSDVIGSMQNGSTGQVIVTGGAVATFHNGLTGVAGSEVRVSTNSAAVFLGPVTGPVTFTGAGAKYFEAGASATGPVAAGGVTVVEQPAALTADHVRESSLTVNGAVTIRPNGGPAGVSRVAALAVGEHGTLDLANNSLIIDYANAASPANEVRSFIATAYNRGPWNGDGITSSAAAANRAYALGYAEAADVLSLTEGATATWQGQTVDATSLLIDYTIRGDTNLDGAVNFQDLVRLAQNYNAAARSWSGGDFDYTGTVSFSDLVALAQNYGRAAAPPLTGFEPQFAADVTRAFASVPEPGTMAPAAAAAASLLRRRTRRSKNH